MKERSLERSTGSEQHFGSQRASSAIVLLQVKTSTKAESKSNHRSIILLGASGPSNDAISAERPEQVQR
jgi:hypothetical protein